MNSTNAICILESSLHQEKYRHCNLVTSSTYKLVDTSSAVEEEEASESGVPAATASASAPGGDATASGPVGIAVVAIRVGRGARGQEDHQQASDAATTTSALF